MSKFKFHKFAAIAVFVATAAWVATGEFSSVGSAQDEPNAERTEAPKVEARRHTVAVVRPPRIEHSRAIRMSGLTEADKRSVLAARSAGIIAELPISKGQSVEAGDLILRLDAEGKEAAVETARQLLVQREAEAEAAERLVQSGSLPRLQADNARSALAAARSQLEEAQAELTRNEVRAPFSGLIDRINVEIGGSVMQGTEIATILALDPIIATGEVGERDLGYVTRGDRADVRLVNGEIVEGEIRYISRDASSQTRTFQVEVAIDNEGNEIPAGMTTEMTLRAKAVESVRLPRSVVTLSGAGDLGIRVVDRQDKVAFYPIDLVDDTPEGLILAGIPADARIIVSGQDLVAEGDTVNAVEADEETIRSLTGEVARIGLD
ncbi:efflux RND transporter periplasmic adaptor subunit [Mesorhizobium sp. YIM 152430]|uniref:efflux RND transporter periplasmic adaptor subunit n=1 Tax=Mesorhizobium sp. YIM 152430 TaxID=3031761 RepID=UPI0023DBD0B8|nr:efflux RND transporter periplasmic adaptor subunit [Mesorhizobium sp. YIM 152430]MDF1599522.1 efflux RND transporter periplasmic adaptor subunit [Mesorhizobium sp. YIM 152430]